MAHIEWSDRLSVGFEDMDADHKRLVEIFNSLDDAISSDREAVEVEEILDQLLSYTVWHFRHEERLMQERGYPGYFDHKREHDELAQAAAEQQQRLLAGDANVAAELMPFLQDWLTNHILGTDLKTGKFLAEHSE